MAIWTTILRILICSDKKRGIDRILRYATAIFEIIPPRALTEPHGCMGALLNCIAKRWSGLVKGSIWLTSLGQCSRWDIEVIWRNFIGIEGELERDNGKRYRYTYRACSMPYSANKSKCNAKSFYGFAPPFLSRELFISWEIVWYWI